MSNPAQIATQIRFHLNQMGAQNQHHGFEHLARHLARLRVYANILPATGPVSGGGDQGCDFETFKTGIAQAPTTGSAFHKFHSGDRDVVFACTLNKKITTKIRADVKAILKPGPVDEIVYFCEPDLAIPKRNMLKTWAKGQGVTLQIFDGQAISEMLADHETLWIAQQYLTLPAELVFPAPEGEDWYQELKARWADREPLPISRADFVEIKSGLRHATFEVQARPDLLNWIAKMRLLQGELSPRALRRNAIYEIAVATLRGTGEMSSQIAALDDYFSDLEDFIELADLTDAATLLTYAFGAIVKQQCDLDDETLFGWLTRVDRVLNDEVVSAQGPGRRAGVLRVLGQLQGLPSPVDRSIDPSRSTRTWSAMLDHAVQAPVFPLESFSEFLTSIMEVTGPNDELIALLNRVDDALAERSGDGSIGERAFETGNLLRDQDRNLAALDQFHRAKVKWFSGEHLFDALRAFLAISDTYKCMGMAFAAKHYALAVAFMANYEQSDAIKQLLPAALFRVADIETCAGHTIGSIHALTIALGANLQFAPDPLHLDKHPSAQELIAQLGITIALTRKGDPDLEACVLEAIASWPDLLRDPVLTIAESDEGFWVELDWPQTWDHLQTAYIDRPFADAGPRRTVKWRALGIDWTVQFDNTYETSAVAEQFLSELQIALAELAHIDLALVPTSIHLNLSIGDQASSAVKAPEVEGERPEFNIVLGPDRMEPNAPAFTQHVLSIITRASLIPDSELMEILSGRMKEVLGRAFVARPYPELYQDHVSAETFLGDLRRRSRAMCPCLDFAQQEDAELAWRDTPGPTYDRAEAIRSVHKRYAAVSAAVGMTARRLALSPDARRHLVNLRLKGARDWEILSIIANIAMNLELGEVDEDGDMEAYRERALAFLARTETEENVLAPERFTEELFRSVEDVYLGAHLDSWRLVAKPDFQDIPAIARFMAVRYRMKIDDVPHDDFFNWRPEDEGEATPVDP